ncbi:MAG TPA: hypothetical protein VFG28_05795, partial [Syntrophales bacterium]|nr:hypothetical protein [Syntrophales bacterium]
MVYSVYSVCSVCSVKKERLVIARNGVTKQSPVKTLYLNLPLPSVTQVVPSAAFNASEDVTLMIERVHQKGGKALFALFGTPTHGGHHNSTFDADETVIRNAAEFYAALQKE